MLQHTFDARSAVRILTGLDLGLQVRVELAPSRQRAIFMGAENVGVQALTSELAEMIGSLRVYSYALRGALCGTGARRRGGREARRAGDWTHARRVTAPRPRARTRARVRSPGRGSGSPIARWGLSMRWRRRVI